MYCKMLGVGTRSGAILMQKNVWKSLVELFGAILVRFSIFSIQMELIHSISREFNLQIALVTTDYQHFTGPVSYTHLTLPTILLV